MGKLGFIVEMKEGGTKGVGNAPMGNGIMGSGGGGGMEESPSRQGKGQKGLKGGAIGMSPFVMHICFAASDMVGGNIGGMGGNPVFFILFASLLSGLREHSFILSWYS